MQTAIQSSHAQYHLIAKSIRYIIDKQTEQPSLKEISGAVGLSEFYLQRLFSEWAGVSPKQFLLYLTKEHAKKTLREHSVMHAALESGLSGSSRLHDLFISHESVTPGEYKTWGKGIDIYYGIHSCVFGYCLIAATDRGVCKLAFFDEDSEQAVLVKELYQEWKYATIHYDHSYTDQLYRQIFLNENSEKKPIHLILKGTPFKLKVWQALLCIPKGQLATYSHVANNINHPKAVRAVASAIANNPIAYLIPCHRVIRKTGMFNEYRWGKVRKAAIHVREQAQRRKNE